MGQSCSKPKAKPADRGVSWRELERLAPAAALKVLRDGGVLPATAKKLVEELGYSKPEDLQHMSEALVEGLDLPPQQIVKVKRLIGACRPDTSAHPASSTGKPGAAHDWLDSWLVHGELGREPHSWSPLTMPGLPGGLTPGASRQTP